MNLKSDRLHYVVDGKVFPYQSDANDTIADWERCRKAADDYAMEQAVTRKCYVMVRLVGPKGSMNVSSASPDGGLQTA